MDDQRSDVDAEGDQEQEAKVAVHGQGEVLEAQGEAAQEGLIFREVAGGLEFVGDFDGLYRGDPDPWHQSGTGDRAGYYSESRARLLDVLGRRLITSEAYLGLEVGTGHGHLLNLLECYLRSWRTKWIGLEVSSVAVEQARRLHKDLDVHVGDIAADELPPLLHPGSFDVVIMAQVLWYVLDRLNRAVENCLRLLKPGGLLVFSQAFLHEQRYGTEIANGFDGLIAYLWREFGELQLIEAHYDDTVRHPFHDGILVLRRL